jgi:hypothetical protein
VRDEWTWKLQQKEMELQTEFAARAETLIEEYQQ